MENAAPSSEEAEMKKVLATLESVLIVCMAQGVCGETWFVDKKVSVSGDGRSWQTAFKTIQEAIDAAPHGDVVVVAEGTYVENVRFNGKNITLRSTDPLSPQVVDATIIDGNQAGSVVTFSGTEDETCVLSGFTIKDGRAERGGGISGGTFDKRTRATIRNNTIAGNSASYGGAMSYCDGIIENNLVTGNSAQHYGGGLAYCGGAVRDNTITDNVAWGSDTGYGGGLALCRAMVQNNTITGNHAKDGGGLCSCNGIIQNNTIEGNSARDGGGLGDCHGTIEKNTIEGNDASRTGGGLAWCNATIRNNTITGNRAAGDGGGVYWCSGTIENNTINGNSAEGGGGGLAFCNGIIQNDLVTANSAQHCGGGLYWCEATLRSLTITRNSTEDSGGGMSDCHGAMGNCIVWGNSASTGPQIYDSATPTYSCIQGWTGGGEGNIAPPSAGFVDPDGPDDDPDTWGDNNYRLRGDSPCVDSGKNENWMAGAADLDGHPRILFGVSSATVDLGAYEYDPFQFKVARVSKVAGGKAELTWSSRPGDNYTVFSCTDLTSAEGWKVEATVSSGGESTIWTDPDILSLRKFYRVGIE
jgi:parallel beta-helix repeat protein